VPVFYDRSAWVEAIEVTDTPTLKSHCRLVAHRVDQTSCWRCCELMWARGRRVESNHINWQLRCTNRTVL